MSLSHKSFNTEDSKGRFGKEDDDYVYDFNPYELDTTKILFSKAGRRLAYKTQVFNQPVNKHIRTRDIHTGEVVGISKIISYILGLNTRLTTAIAYGHDIGHFPLGHTTEELFTNKLREETGSESLILDHSLMGLILVNCVERKGLGLNLTYETMEGILNHSVGGGDFRLNEDIPEEYKVVRYADKIAYVFSDVNDAERIKSLNPNSEVFKPIYDNLKIIEDSKESKINGKQRRRTYNCISALVEESINKDTVVFSEGTVFNAFEKVRKNMYDLVYHKIKWNVQNTMVETIAEVLEQATIKDYENVCRKTLNEYFLACKRKDLELPGSNFLPHPFLIMSLLTDADIRVLVEKQISSNSLTLKNILYKTPLSEIVPYLLTKKIDIIGLSEKWGKYGKKNPRPFLDEFLKKL